MDDEVFTEAEARYFSSGGKEAIPTEQPQQQTTQQPDTQQQQPPAGTQQAQQEVAEEEPGEVLIDEQGRVRAGKTGRWVPLQVLQKERDANKQFKSKLSELEEWQKKVQDKLFNALTPREQPKPVEEKKPEPKPIIDPREDLIGAMEQDRKEREALAKRIEESEKRTSETFARQQQEQLVRDDLSRAAASDVPDIREAYGFLLQHRWSELAEYSAFQNADGTPNKEKIAAQIKEDSDSMALDALKSGRSVAKQFHKLATLRGYKKAEPAATQQTTQQQPAATQQTAAPQKTAAQEKVEQIARGQAGARTLGVSGGASNGLTMEEFLGMDEDVISARYQGDASFRAQVDQLYGRRA